MGVALDARALLAVDVLLLGMDLEPGELTAVQVRGLPASLRTCVPAYLRTCVPAYLPTYLPTYQAWVRRGGALIVSVPHPAEPEEPPERQVLRSPALARSQPDPPPTPSTPTPVLTPYLRSTSAAGARVARRATDPARQQAAPLRTHAGARPAE